MSNNAVVPAEKFLPPESQEFQTDLDYVRKNQIELIEQGIKGLDGILTVADQSQHPRAYEVLSGYLKTMSELNKDFTETAIKKKEVKEVGIHNDNGNVTNNLFVGTTEELQKLLDQKK